MAAQEACRAGGPRQGKGVPDDIIWRARRVVPQDGLDSGKRAQVQHRGGADGDRAAHLPGPWPVQQRTRRVGVWRQRATPPGHARRRLPGGR